LPSGSVGILTGTLIGISRILGETAPLLFTAFGNQFLNLNLLKPMSTIPYLIYVYATSPYKDWHNQAFAASTILIIIVLSINLLGRFIEKNGKHNFKDYKFKCLLWKSKSIKKMLILKFMKTG